MTGSWSHLTDHDVVDAMLTLGGNFVRHLARAFQAADTINQQRIKNAFADEWQQYAELASLRKTREQAPREPAT